MEPVLKTGSKNEPVDSAGFKTKPVFETGSILKPIPKPVLNQFLMIFKRINLKIKFFKISLFIKKIQKKN